MSDQDTTVTVEDSNETAPEPSRFKKVLAKIAPYAPYITTAVVGAVSGALIVKALNTLEDEVEIVETETIIVETPEDV